MDIRPSNPNQPIQPITGPQPAQPTQPTPPTQQPPAQPAPPAQHQDQSEAVQRQFSVHNPVQGNPDQDEKTLDEALHSPENLSELDKRLSDADPNDLSQVKNQLLGVIKDSLGKDKAKDFLLKLNSPTQVPDPQNPGKTIARGKLYERMLQSFINEYKSAPPEQRQKALENLAHLLAGGAVKVINDKDDC